jgi:hypothetical protein
VTTQEWEVSIGRPESAAKNTSRRILPTLIFRMTIWIARTASIQMTTTIWILPPASIPLRASTTNRSTML